jgi:proteic killer suppression protein
MEVNFTKLALKQFKKAPLGIQNALLAWATEVNIKGLEATRQRKGFHDEPLKGERFGQRSVRLNHQWRAIYTIDNHTVILTVLEVTPHDYRTR